MPFNFGRLRQSIKMFSSEDFFLVPIFFYNCIGSSVQPFGRPNSIKKAKKVFYIFMLNYSTLYCLYTAAYVYYAFGEGNFVDGLTACSSFVVGFMSVAKNLNFSYEIRAMTQIKKELEALFPSEEDQKRYKVKDYQSRNHRVFYYYGLSSMISCTSWVLTPIAIGIFNYILTGVPYERNLPFYAHYFYDTKSNILVYTTTYFLEIISGFVVSILYFGTDMIMCCIVMQLCMHFDYISTTLEDYKPTGVSRSDQEFLLPMIDLHKRCLM